MEPVKDLLERYRRYLIVMDEWAPSWDDDRLELLSPGEAFDILSIRDRLKGRGSRRRSSGSSSGWTTCW
jgi:hypothetical protein